MRRSSRALALLCLCVGGCAAPAQLPVFDDQQYFTLGVDPKAETKALIHDLKREGFEAEPLLHGERFYALGIRHADLTSIGVRIVTVRGIALALDRIKPTIFQEEVRYRLLLPPWPNTHDVDGDGNEEVFVEVQRGSDRRNSCVSVYRISAAGTADLIDGDRLDFQAPDGQRFRAPTFCEFISASESTPEAPASASP